MPTWVTGPGETVSVLGRGSNGLRPTLGEGPAGKNLTGQRAGAGCPSGEARRLSSPTRHSASFLLPWPVQTTHCRWAPPPPQRAGQGEKGPVAPHLMSLSPPLTQLSPSRVPKHLQVSSTPSHAGPFSLSEPLLNPFPQITLPP